LLKIEGSLENGSNQSASFPTLTLREESQKPSSRRWTRRTVALKAGDKRRAAESDTFDGDTW
jgi:hypothetical protein